MQLLLLRLLLLPSLSFALICPVVENGEVSAVVGAILVRGSVVAVAVAVAVVVGAAVVVMVTVTMAIRRIKGNGKQ